MAIFTSEIGGQSLNKAITIDASGERTQAAETFTEFAARRFRRSPRYYAACVRRAALDAGERTQTERREFMRRRVADLTGFPLADADALIRFC